MEETLSKDLDKMLSLLKEYTVLLREICRQELDRRSRLNSIRSLLGVTAAGVTVFVFRLSPIDVSKLPDPGFWQSVSLGLAVLIGFGSVISLFKQSDKYTYDAYQVAFTLGKLTQMVSQYSEHATNRISDKFELDLRLAEAEGVLRMHRQVFDHSLWRSESSRTVGLREATIYDSASTVKTNVSPEGENPDILKGGRTNRN